MNILFVYTSAIVPENGGVQRITTVLQSYFKDKGLNCYYLSLKKDEHVDKDIHYFFPDIDNVDSSLNSEYYISILKEKKIDIVINQAALGGTLCRLCASAKNETNVKIISVVHNSLLANVKNYTESHNIQNEFLIKILKSKVISFFLLKLYLQKYKSKYEYMCQHSDKVVLLSKSFEKELEEFTEVSYENVTSIGNPLSIKKEEKKDILKENVLLYVGRLDTTQKKVDYLLKIWSKIYKKHSNWSLSILGDGEEKEYLEKLSKDLSLERVTFHGKQNPVEFYQKSKILCMTSAFEGFPLVLAEAQLFGTVPIAFNSFAALEDIVIDGENGKVIEAFNFDKYIVSLEKLMEDEVYLNELSKNCESSIERLSLEYIGDKWIEIMHNLKKEKR